MKIEKLHRVDVPVEAQESEGCVAFQLIRFTINYFGAKQTFTLDSKIMADGRQFVHGENGWVKYGTEI